MNRNDFIQAVASREGFAVQDCTQIIDAALEVVAMSMSSGEEINLRNFGKFIPSISPATTRRNPQTGGSVDVPEKIRVKFVPSKTLKDRANS